jgi:hypothetical protein
VQANLELFDEQTLAFLVELLRPEAAGGKGAARPPEHSSPPGQQQLSSPAAAAAARRVKITVPSPPRPRLLQKRGALKKKKPAAAAASSSSSAVAVTGGIVPRITALIADRNHGAQRRRQAEPTVSTAAFSVRWGGRFFRICHVCTAAWAF